ncbi:MAG: imidazole glycerol phosphate synthase subunit HisH [Acidimicrobiia bacterium]
MSAQVVVVPTGIANTASVAAAFRRIGTELSEAGSAEEIRSAHRLVLPGVGAFAAAMERIDEREWRQALVDRIGEGKPTLAICLGMQLLCEKSDESPGVSGLGVVSGTVTRLPEHLTVPQLGWNQVMPAPGSRFLTPGWAYFANSYRLTSVPNEWTSAHTSYGGSFVSAIERGNLLACQFHPELSGDWGSELLSRWLNGTRVRS